MKVISCILQGIELGTMQSYANLTVYPLLSGKEVSQLPDYLLLDEALNKGLVEISEIGKGRVPELLVINNAQEDLLLISGEELLGAKQNRTVNLSVLIPAQSSLKIPVSCTERERWQEGKNKGKIREGAAHYSSSQVRRVLLSSVTDSLKIKGTYDSDQVSIWDSKK